MLSIAKELKEADLDVIQEVQREQRMYMFEDRRAL